MKGTFFQKPLEYNIEISGESWNQGATFEGSLSLKNHGLNAIDISQVGCHLCFASTKKIKNKDDKAFLIIENSLFKKQKIEPQSQENLIFKFQLADDIPITDSLSGPYILCGEILKPYKGGLLELKITPKKTILDFIQIFETFFKFKFKALKNKKEFIESKLIPPDSRDWSSIQSMSLKMKMNQNNLELHYTFKLKKMTFDSSVISTKDTTSLITKILSEKEYSDFSGAIHQENIIKTIKEVLDQVRIKSIKDL